MRTSVMRTSRESEGRGRARARVRRLATVGCLAMLGVSAERAMGAASARAQLGVSARPGTTRLAIAPTTMDVTPVHAAVTIRRVATSPTPPVVGRASG